MKRILAVSAALLTLAVASPRIAVAQSALVLPGGCGTASWSAGSKSPSQSAAGQNCMASTVYTSTGFQQVGSFSTSTGFTPPTGSTVCFIQAEGNSVRFRTDGVAPTASVGQLLAVGALLQETSNLAGIKFIPTTGNATLDVDCYKQ